MKVFGDPPATEHNDTTFMILASIGLRVVVLSAWLHYLLGTTLAQIIDVFNFHLHFELSAGGLVSMWHRLREILLAWHLEIHAHALSRAVLHADETGWRVNGTTHWLSGLSQNRC